MKRTYLTTRDLALLADLGSYRFLSAAQAGRLHFPSTRSAEDRLRRLKDAGLATRVARQLSVRDGRREMVYALTKRGATALALRSGLQVPFLARERERSALFLEHALALADVRVALELVSQQGLVQLGAWRVEKDAVRFRAYAGRYQQRVTVIPDAYFVLVDAGRAHRFYLEVDMGTVRLRRMLARYKAYAHHVRGAPRHAGTPLRVLTVASSARRAGTLRRLAAEALGGRTSQLFAFASLEELCLEDGGPGRILDAFWRPASLATDRDAMPERLLTS